MGTLTFAYQEWLGARDIVLPEEVRLFVYISQYGLTPFVLTVELLNGF